MKSIKHLKLSEQEQLNIRGLLNRNTRELQNGCLEWIAGTNGEYPVLWTGVRQLADKQAATLVKQGYSVMSACYRVGLPYSSLTRRIINETCR